MRKTATIGLCAKNVEMFSLATASCYRRRKQLMSAAGQLGLLLLYILIACAMIRLQAYSMRSAGRTSLRRTERWLLPGICGPAFGTVCINSRTVQPTSYHSMSSGCSTISQRTSYKLYSSVRSTSHGTERTTHPSVALTTEESELFDLLLQFVKESNLNTTVRVAGGWVRDKVLQLPSKFDIDLALENVTGVQFATQMKNWLTTSNRDQTMAFAVIEQNVEKSKHLETGNIGA